MASVCSSFFENKRAAQRTFSVLFLLLSRFPSHSIVSILSLILSCTCICMLLVKVDTTMLVTVCRFAIYALSTNRWLCEQEPWFRRERVHLEVFSPSGKRWHKPTTSHWRRSAWTRTRTRSGTITSPFSNRCKYHRRCEGVRTSRLSLQGGRRFVCGKSEDQRRTQGLPEGYHDSHGQRGTPMEGLLYIRNGLSEAMARQRIEFGVLF